MINLIICDDNKKDLEKVYKVVTNFMSANKLEYKKFVFSDYNDSFMNLTKLKISFKVYILDIETPSRSGIDVARDIRRKDADSPIIFLTGHNELGLDLLSEDIPFTAFINKFVNCEARLKKCLSNAIKQMYKHRLLKIQDGSSLYTINLDDIIYITKDSFERKTVIVTDNGEFKLNKSLSAIKEMLDDSFVQTHRACIINKNRTVKIDFASRLILFDNQEQIDLLSIKYRKEVLK